MKRILILTLALSYTTLLGCGDDSEYDPNWGDDQLLPAGKGDFSDIAEPIAFGESKTGTVTETQLDVYRLELTAGDKFTLRKDVTSGDLRPDVSLFTSSGRSMSSLNFDVSGSRLEKTYHVESSGKYLVAVRAFRNEGSGKYKVQAICTGGPCNGELNDPTDFFEMDTMMECVNDIRICSLSALPRYNGRVGDSRSASIWNGCAETTGTPDGDSCESVCDSSEDVAGLCDSIIRSLPFYADQTTECVDELNGCMNDCIDIGNDGYHDDDEVYEQPLSMCWDGGFNSTCDTYVRQLPVCGGNVTNEAALCEMECHVSWGVFTDDSSDLCDHCDRCGIECQMQLRGETFDGLGGLVGDVTDTWIGEVDPFVLGDVCIIYVQVFSSDHGDYEPGLYGLVDESLCSAQDVRDGWGIHIAASSLEAMTNSNELEELNNLQPATYLRHTGEYEEVY